MAHKKGQGSSRNGRDSNAKRLGVKVYDGQIILSGGIILKQRGTKVHAGENVKRAADGEKRKTQSRSTKRAAKTVSVNIEKTTLGDISVLAALKTQMEETQLGLGLLKIPTHTYINNYLFRECILCLFMQKV